ncbi:MAG TPA: carcinine hydrolase/isopenicillin-N N-acyltransferase family protein, partial [Puia sp.]|nr:carcinine hydrolase/isopenicillin-N N-acyltransferase family protein [Puia sp.]
SFLVGSAEDGKAVIIEKTPDSMAVYDPQRNYIICANHFQSKGLGKLPSNLRQISESASAYRYQRLQQLLDSTGQNTVERTIAILRDRKGLNGEDIGLGNEKALNQLIAHHSIVFEPKKGLVWVSTAPWQLGKFVCYDLNKVFSLAGMNTDREIVDSSLNVPADPFLETPAYQSFLRFHRYKEILRDGGRVNPDSLIESNPQFYQAYELAGNIWFNQKKYAEAAHCYELALSKVIATKGEENDIRRRLEKAKEKMK